MLTQRTAPMTATTAGRMTMNDPAMNWLVLELLLAAPVECQLSTHHDIQTGTLGKNHDDGGAVWQMKTLKKCCGIESGVLVCDTVHTHLLQDASYGEREWKCAKCGEPFGFADIYVESVKWG